MNIRLLLLFFLLFAGLVPNNSLFSQNSFELTYATPIDEEIFDGILHSSGNIYLIGRNGSYQTHHFNPFILKIYPDGEMQSVEWIAEDSVGMFPCILELNDQNIALVGQCGLNSENENNKRWLRIIDPGLNIISDNFYSQDSSYISVYQNNSIIDHDGNITVIGTIEFARETPGFTTTDLFMAKYSPNGDSLDFRIYNFPDHPEESYEITTIPESSDYQAITNAFFIGMPSPQIVRINNELDIISNKWIEGVYQSPLSVDHWLNENNFLMSCQHYESEEEEDKIAVIQIDTSTYVSKILELDKPDTSDYPAWFNSMEFVNDSTIYIGGFVNYFALWPMEPSYLELYLIDISLNVLGYRQFGGDINYRLDGIVKTDDGGCLLYSNTYSENNNYHEHDIRIFKIPRDSVEIITQIHDLPGYPQKEISAYPNPASDIIHIPLDGHYQDANVQLYKVEGKKVYDAQTTGSGNLISIKVNHLPAGIYFYKLTSSGQIFRAGKFVKL